jgi:hypothetical protein
MGDSRLFDEWWHSLYERVTMGGYAREGRPNILVIYLRIMLTDKLAD